MPKRSGQKAIGVSPQREPVPEEILEFVRALARLQARRDHDREMEALAAQLRAHEAAEIVHPSDGEQADGGPGIRLGKR
jgi:hypothetical protein